MSKVKKKLLLLFIFFIAFLFFSVRPSFADSQFSVDTVVTYKINDSGSTLVTHDITLTNLYSTLYATSYTLSLDNMTADSVKALDSAGNVIPLEQTKDDKTLNIKLNFKDAVVGKGAKRHFSISYENSNFAVKTGEVWEVSIPKIADATVFRNYSVNLIVPESFGKEAYISPEPDERTVTGGLNTYVFNKDKITQTGVTAGFGQFQVFTFDLQYHLENPLAVYSKTEIALPPDTAFQKVYYSKINPKPDDVRIDSDGNYIAIYKLNPRQRIDVVADGSVQIFAGFRSFPSPASQTLADNLKPTGYWQSDNQEIKDLAANLKTPEEIYKFVTSKLKYDFDRVKPNVTRLGATGALQNPTQAICMEFTDLFIALARAAGIPAREINGYAYTENKELQPLSLVADVLHAWPEYYDRTKGVWIPIDPTWGSTSGTDYFNKLDLRHFTFVIHGDSDTKPYPPGSYKLGPNPQKDVFVSFGSLPNNRNSVAKINVKNERNIPFLDLLYSYSIYNPGPSTMYAFYPTVYFDGKLNSRVLVEMLPPFATFTGKIKVPYSLLGKDTPESIKITAEEAQLTFSTNKSQVVINTLLILFAVFILIMLLILEKSGRLNFSGFTGKITGVYAKITGKFSKNKNNL